MKILAIDTSCDETAAAVTEDTTVLSNIIWSQASLHAKFGGVMPSLAQRLHEERIDWVIHKALGTSHKALDGIDAIAVTIGPGLSIALGVGVNKAKELAKKYNKPLIPVNHVESHILSPLAKPKSSVSSFQFPVSNDLSSFKFPMYGLVVSGGNTIFVLIKNIGDYKVLAETQDDALGEALDKGARMLGLGYPGGAILEKMARSSRFAPSGKARYNPFKLPVPLVGQEKRQMFSYSGLKTSFYRLIESHKKLNPNFPTKQDVYDLAASFQDVAFKHIERILSYYFTNHQSPVTGHLLLGGGVSANIELRRRLRKLGDKFGVRVHIPYTTKLCSDNAAMIGVTSYLNLKYVSIDKIDRYPNLKI